VPQVTVSREDDMPAMNPDPLAAFEAEIRPLTQAIDEKCKEHGMPLLMLMQMKPGEGPGGVTGARFYLKRRGYRNECMLFDYFVHCLAEVSGEFARHLSAANDLAQVEEELRSRTGGEEAKEKGGRGA
jgi:hypothetical protein